MEMFTLPSPETINSPQGKYMYMCIPFLFGKADGPYSIFGRFFTARRENLIGRVDTRFVGSKNNGYDS